MSVVNAATMTRLRTPVGPVTDSVVVCVPARDEEKHLPSLVADLCAQRYDGQLTVLILDDGSSDDTAAVARAAAAGDERVQVTSTTGPPEDGWTGKAAACRTLAQQAFTYDPDILVFVDADVRLADTALAAAVAARRALDAALVCPWPEQRTGSVAERLVQPLLSFSWMSTLPVRVADRSSRPSTVVACGQMMVFDASAYLDIGGHAAVASSATEDLDIARALRRRGHRTAVASGAGFVSCRMYDGWSAVSNGYTRWLWSAFGGPIGTAAVAALMTLTYVVPPVAAVLGSGPTRRAGVVGYGAAVVARTVAAQSERGFRRSHLGADLAVASTNPLSVVTYLGLCVVSHRRHARGELTWKRRPLVAADSDASR
ncbi:glycosyltransferase [Rhodococcoides kyotonense]